MNERNEPLKNYFLNARDDYYLKTYNDIANHFGISRGIVNNAICGQTINPSRRLVQKLSINQNKKPEIILANIYEQCFITPNTECLEIVVMSLYYHFGYTLFFNNDNFLKYKSIILPFVNQNITVSAFIRQNGPELKYTGVVVWCDIRDNFSKAYNHNSFYEYNNNEPYKPFPDQESFLLAIASGLYTILNSDDMSEFKRLIVVFNSENEDEVEAYEQIRQNLNDSSLCILPLLYDKDAEYSIRDTDQLKKNVK